MHFDKYIWLSTKWYKNIIIYLCHVTVPEIWRLHLQKQEESSSNKQQNKWFLLCNLRTNMQLDKTCLMTWRASCSAFHSAQDSYVCKCQSVLLWSAVALMCANSFWGLLRWMEADRLFSAIDQHSERTNLPAFNLSSLQTLQFIRRISSKYPENVQKIQIHGIMIFCPNQFLWRNETISLIRLVVAQCKILWNVFWF